MGVKSFVSQNRVQIGCRWVQLLKFDRRDQLVDFLGRLGLYVGDQMTVDIQRDGWFGVSQTPGDDDHRDAI
jgi:hypothetical protein